MASLLIVTTSADLSLRLLVTAGEAKAMQVGIALFDEPLAAFSKKLQSEQWDVVYVRDPFNTGRYSQSSIAKRLQLLTGACPDAYYIDHTRTMQDVLFEDKWRQYQKLQKYMPSTELLTKAGQFKRGQHIIKKRLSSRSRGIYFGLSSSLLSGNYIVQPRLELTREYRVFVIGGEVCETVSLRQSKAPRQKLTTLRVAPIPKKIAAFAARIAAVLPGFDLLGLDIAELPDGRHILLEANRSCQFAKFTQLSGINPAVELLEAITDSKRQ